jgi:cyclopropane fatty-acyl-phospholipid synthase-like methyltransferase
LLHFQQCFCIRGHWILDSAHYQKTLEAWQENLDARRSDVRRLFQATYGETKRCDDWCDGAS